MLSFFHATVCSTMFCFFFNLCKKASFFNVFLLCNISHHERQQKLKKKILYHLQLHTIWVTHLRLRSARQHNPNGELSFAGGGFLLIVTSKNVILHCLLVNTFAVLRCSYVATARQISLLWPFLSFFSPILLRYLFPPATFLCLLAVVWFYYI